MEKKKSIVFNFKNTIGYILFKKIFLGYILFVLTFTSYQIYKEYEFAKNLVLKDMTNVEKSFSDVLAKTIWHFDENKVNDQVKAIVDGNDISGISILTPYNEIISLYGMLDPKYADIKEYVFEKRIFDINYALELQTYSFDLIDYENSPDEVLAKVTIYTKNTKILEFAQEAVSLIIINVIVSAVILWLLFLYFANRLLTIPLNQMIEATNDLTIKEISDIHVDLNTNEKHELFTLLNTFNDMSKRMNESYINMKQLTMIQEKQKEDLKNANKYKNDFLANMSHELKTPLNSINVISSVMMKNKNNSLDEKQVHNLKIINNCGNDLLFLINDVLDISKLEAGELKLDFRQINVYQLMLDIKHMFDHLIEEKHVNFIFECDEGIGDIYTDDNRVKQIVKNLISNAIKFVDHGKIDFLVKDDDKNIVVYVKDDGIGISEEKLLHIFDRFKQADSSTTRKYGGTGLGLAICKELLNLLEGDITVNSKVGVGSVFKVTIPKKSENVKQHKVIKQDNLESIQSKDKVVLLNHDPISFLSLSVELKKEFDLKQVTSFNDLKEFCNKTAFKYIIIDITKENESDISTFLENCSNKIIIVYDEIISDDIKNKAYLCVSKPIDTKRLISQINN